MTSNNISHNFSQLNNIRSGQKATITYENREFDVIVIDPDGLGQGQPSVGFGFRMMEKHAGLPQPTLSKWLTEESGFEGDSNSTQKSLKLPSGKLFRVNEILGLDNNEYFVLEVSEWVALAADVLKNPGKLQKSTKDRLIDFLSWFAVKSIYSEAYVFLKGIYTDRDSRATTRWANDRLSGIPTRKEYTDFLQSVGCKDRDYSYWTDYIYAGLFGMRSQQMKKIWQCVAGSKKIARNYIPEAEGLQAVKYCEDMTIRVYTGDLQEAHDIAINLTIRKFGLAEAA